MPTSSLHDYAARFNEQKKISLHNERMKLVYERTGKLVCPYCYESKCVCDTSTRGVTA